MSETQQIVSDEFETENLRRMVRSTSCLTRSSISCSEACLFLGVGEEMKGNAVEFGQARGCGITVDHDADRAGQLARAVMIEQGGKTMVVARHQDGNPGVAQSKMILD